MIAVSRPWIWGAFLSFAAVCGVARAQNGDDLPDVVKKMIDSSDRLRYSGTRVVLLKFGPDQHRHVEYVIRDGKRTRIEFPEEGTYQGQIIVETDSERRHFFPNDNHIEILPPRRDEFMKRWLNMGNRGPKPTFKVSIGPAIAGVSTKEVEMVAPDGFVFQRVWIDGKTGLALKRELYNKEGKVQASSEFTKVDFRPKFSRKDFILDIPGAKIITPRDRLSEMVEKGSFLNLSLPPKDPFRLESCRIQRIGNSVALVQDYVNKDGRVSIFQIRTGIDPDKLRRRGGDINTYSWQKNGASFVILGNFPENKLREIAQRFGN